MTAKQEKLFGVVEGFYGKPWTTVQRKELFKRMKQLNLNVYMFGPKDCKKHRAYWRELYSPEEGEQLKGLISAAREANVEFYYSISPGLDMIYSSSKEVQLLKRKLEQVAQFGCNAFAILFDDIEPELSETDKEVFKSFAEGHVSVTNEIYEALNRPEFMFCPTEYCASRAIPNVRSSEYLNTIGSKLHPEIMVMWTGTKVISKTLTVQQLEELEEVLKRQPIVWDNLTANDFDQRRVFLGPYDGRSTDIKQHVRGVLSNPNCEFEANFITLHTISQWSQCEGDAKPRPARESSSDDGEPADGDSFCNLSPSTYHPKRALKLAIEDWLIEFNRSKHVFPKPSDIISKPLTSSPSHLAGSQALTVDEDGKERNEQMIDDLSNAIKDGVPISDSAFQPITKELTNSLLDPPVILNPSLEPMDCADIGPVGATVAANGGDKAPSIDETMEDSQPIKDGDEPKDEEELKSSGTESSSEEMQTDPSNMFTYDEVSFFVDLFYLPFEHGKTSLTLLSEFHWLINNAHLIANYRAKKAINPEQSPDVVEWYQRAIGVEKHAIFVSRLLNKLTLCKNRCLLYELYPYLWELHSMVSLLNSYVKWLSLGHVPTEPSLLQSSFNWFSKGYREAFESGDQEPWLFRNGLFGDLQRLLPLESVNDLFLYRAPDSPSSHIFNIRPYAAADEQHVYEICRKTSLTTGSDDFQLFNDVPDLIGDRFVGSFLTLSSDFCFVIEDEVENKICGYILAAPDSQQFQKKIEMAWMPELTLKYPAPVEKLNKNEKLTSVEQMINDLHEEQKRKFIISETVHSNFPSICRINILDYVLENDPSVPKRLLTCLLAALKANGSKGLFSVVDGASDKKAIELCLKLGFSDIYCPNELKLNENDLYLGRNI